MMEQTTVERASGLALEHQRRLESRYRVELRQLVDGKAGWTSQLNASMRGLGLTPQQVEDDLHALEEFSQRAASAEAFDEEENAQKRGELRQEMREIDAEIGRLRERYEPLARQDRHLYALRSHARETKHALARLRENHPRLFTK